MLYTNTGFYLYLTLNFPLNGTFSSSNGICCREVKSASLLGVSPVLAVFNLKLEVSEVHPQDFRSGSLKSLIKDCLEMSA